MTKENEKDWLEGTGIGAVIALLIFVGLQMRRAQKIVVGEFYLYLGVKNKN